MRLRIYLLALCILFLSACTALLERPSEKIEGDADQALRAFAQKHSLAYAELKERLNDVQFSIFRKGGLAMIAPDAYINLDEPRNALILPNYEWKGKTSSSPEIVMTDGVHVVDSLGGVDSSKVIIVFFFPSEVRYIRINGSGGAFYKRLKPMSQEEAKAYIKSHRPKSAE